MAKFLKSIFAPSEKKRAWRCEGEEGEDKSDFNPPLDDRRKLSISRSGKMKQANKKRHSLSLDVYGEANSVTEKTKSVEYHVNSPAKPIHSDTNSPRRHSGDPQTLTTTVVTETGSNQNKESNNAKTPEEEIDSAFEIIDKIS